MILGISGSRSYINYEHFKDLVKGFLEECNNGQLPTEIVSGAAEMAERFAKENNVPIKVFKPRYTGNKEWNRIAPLACNKEIVSYCTFLIAFLPTEEPRGGTLHAINFARGIGKPVKIYRV